MLIKRSVRLQCAVFCLICCAGCVVLPTAYYRPNGEGQLLTGAQFEHGCVDKFNTKAVDGVALEHVQAIPHGRNTILRVEIAVDKSRKWFQLEKDELQLYEPEFGIRRVVKISILKKSYSLVGDVNHKEIYNALDRIENTHSIPYDLEIEILDFRPRTFVLTFPAVIVDDQRVELPPISFEHKRGVRLYNLGQ